jgi:hypothetical protein
MPNSIPNGPEQESKKRRADSYGNRSLPVDERCDGDQRDQVGAEHERLGKAGDKG